jgi:hypothetical protein
MPRKVKEKHPESVSTREWKVATITKTGENLKYGTTSLGLTLPYENVQEAKLKQGDLVYIRNEEIDGSISIRIVAVPKPK